MNTTVLTLSITIMGFLFWNKEEKDDSKAVKQRLEISDDSGFIGVVNNKLYDGFINEDWQLQEVLDRFENQTNKGHCAIWSTGVQTYMSLEILDNPSPKKSFRETFINLQVTDNCLWLSNYTDLTMVAQFNDAQIPSKENSDLKIPLANGNYKLLVRQMFAPNEYNWNSPPKTCFELVFTPIEEFTENQYSNVIWWDLDNKK